MGITPRPVQPGWISISVRHFNGFLIVTEQYVSHLNALVRDTFVRVTDREKVKGNLKKWKDPNILVGTALYIELLKPAACLS